MRVKRGGREQIGSFVTGKLLSRFGFKAAFYMHAAFSVPTLLILLRFSPKKEDRGKAPPKFGELYRLVVHDVDVLVSGWLLMSLHQMCGVCGGQRGFCFFVRLMSVTWRARWRHEEVRLGKVLER